VVTDRARLLGMYWDDARQWYARAPRAFDVTGGIVFYILRPWMANRVAAQVALFNEAVVAARRPWPDRLRIDAPNDAAIAQARSRVPWLPGLAMAPGRDLTSAMHRERMQRTANTLAIVRAAIAATAVARFRQTHGALPATLDQLTPSLLAAVPIDPYSGKPLRYAQQDTAFVVYSIGRNEKDDGGKELNQQLSKRWGPYTRARETADIGLQVEFARTAPR